LIRELTAYVADFEAQQKAGSYCPALTFSRGLARRSRRMRAAEDDLDRALRLRPLIDSRGRMAGSFQSLPATQNVDGRASDAESTHRARQRGDQRC
jgi:hypothetical protein